MPTYRVCIYGHRIFRWTKLDALACFLPEIVPVLFSRMKSGVDSLLMGYRDIMGADLVRRQQCERRTQVAPDNDAHRAGVHLGAH